MGLASPKLRDEMGKDVEGNISKESLSKVKPKITQKRLKSIKVEIARAEEKVEAADIMIRNQELEGPKLLETLIQIESTRINVVSKMWEVVQEIANKIGEQVGASEHDISKLAIVMGIMVDKAQLIQGGPTARFEQTSGRKMSLIDRMKSYQELTSAKVGRPKEIGK